MIKKGLLLSFIISLVGHTKTCPDPQNLRIGIAPDFDKTIEYLNHYFEMSKVDGYMNPYEAHSRLPHVVQIINDGPAALATRLKMIDQATTTIDIETYIFKDDQSGQLILQALLKKKRENPQIKVRLLLDYNVGGPDIRNEAILQELAGNGIDIKFFNKCNILEVALGCNRRNHQKIFVIDGQDAIIGGRNIANEYFGLHQDYNYDDRDVRIKGRIGYAASLAFYGYWRENGLVEPLDLSNRARYLRGYKNATNAPSTEEEKTAIDFLTPNESSTNLRTQILRHGEIQMKNSQPIVVNDVSFFADKPWQTEDGRKVGPEISRRMTSAQNISIENAYFIPPYEDREILMNKLNQGNPVSLLTNGFKSSDNSFTTMLAYSRYYKLTRHGMETHMHSATAGKPNETLPQTKDARWGTHAKTFIFDKKDVFIGSYNMDRRSRNLNWECGVIINNRPDVAAIIESDIRRRTSLKTPANKATCLQAISNDCDELSPIDDITKIFTDGTKFMYEDQF